MMGIQVPEVGDQFKIGNTSIYVISVEADQYSHGDYNSSYCEGRTLVTGHDDNGEEVEVWFYPARDDEDEDY